MIKKISMITFLILNTHNMVAMNVIKDVGVHLPETLWLAAKAIPQYMPTVLSTAPAVLNGPGVAIQAGCTVCSILMHYVTKKNGIIKETKNVNVGGINSKNNIAFTAPLLTIAVQLGLQISALCYQKRMTCNTAMYALIYSGLSVGLWGIKEYLRK